MAEAAFRSVQIGKESAYGTEVNATLILPVEAASGELHLERGTNTPDEDFGMAIRNQTLRGSHGVRLVSGSVSAVASFQTLPHFLQMSVGDVVTTGSSAPYTHVVERDTTADTTSSYTWEVNDDTQDWIGVGITIPTWELGFEALAAGENAAWMFSGDLQGVNLSKGTATAAQAAPATETMEGHLTTIKEGTTATAFASLTTLTNKLVSLSLSGSDEKPPRAYAGGDTHSARGRRKGVTTINASFLLDSTTLGSTHDLYNVSGAVPTYRRWRIGVTGSGSNAATIDMQVLITDCFIEPDGRDGERLVTMTGESVYDSTLTSDLVFSIVNATTSY